MKKLISFTMSLVLMLSLVQSAFAVSKPQVQLSSQNLRVNGETITGLEIYNIDGSNYFKLRDVAYLLNGTESQFNVLWDAEFNCVILVMEEQYFPQGGECSYNGSDKSATAVKSSQEIITDIGDKVEAEAYNIGGNNFLKLRDLLSYTTASVDWDGKTNTIIVTTPDYSQSSQSTTTATSPTEVTSASNELYDVDEWRRLWGNETVDALFALHDEMWSSGKITSSSNQRQIAGVYYKWLDTNVKYDFEVMYLSHFPTGAMLNHKAVCDGFAGAYEALLKIEGIDCKFCSGYEHAWNKVVLDGRTLYIDVSQETGCFAESGMMSDTHGWQYDDAEYMMAELERCEAWLGWKF